MSKLEDLNKDMANWKQQASDTQVATKNMARKGKCLETRVQPIPVAAAPLNNIPKRGASSRVIGNEE